MGLNVVVKIKSDQDLMHNDKDKKACEGHPNFHRRLPQKLDVKSHLSTEDRLSELVGQFVQLQKHGHSNEMEVERNDTMTNTHINILKAIQPPRHMNLVHSVTIMQKENRTKNM